MLAGLVLSVGCGGGGSSNFLKAFAAVLVIAAVASTGGAASLPVFAASGRADLRAVVQTKYEAALFINDVQVATTTAITISGNKLELDEPFTYNSGVAAVEYKVVFRPAGKLVGFTYVGNVTLTDSETSTIGSTIAPIEATASTTANALTYELWKDNVVGASTKTYADFMTTANQTQIDTTVDETSTDLTAIFDAAATTFANAIPVATPIAVATPVPTTTTTNRLTGNYRAFTYSSGIQNRWSSMCEIAVTGDQLVSIVKIDPSDPVGTRYTATVSETAGEFTLSGDTPNRGVVSPSGNFAIIHDWQSDDPNTALLVKMPTAATNATLNGTYLVYECSDDVNATYVPTKATTQAFTMTFNNGTFTSQSAFDPYSEWDNSLNNGNYSVADDGTVTIVGLVANRFMQVSADGNVFVSVSYIQGEYCDMSIGIKQGGSAWKGNYLHAIIQGYVNEGVYSSCSSSSLITATGSSFSELDRKTENLSLANMDLLINEDYTIINAGIINITAAPESNYGSIDPSGEVYCITTKYINNPMDGRFFAFGVKK